MDNFDKLGVLRKTLPDIYNILTPEQIKEFLDEDESE